MNNWGHVMIGGLCLCGRMMVFYCLASVCFIANYGNAEIDDGVFHPEQKAHYENAPWITKQYAQDQKQFSGDDQVMVRRGLVASRRDKVVQFYASSTGLNDGDTIEFYLVGEESSHGYEALAISFASPGDIREALIFIGMQPGVGVDYDNLRFWPKGERVKITVGGATTNSAFDIVPLESLLWDYADQKEVLSHGFVFTGSRYVSETMEVSGAELVLAADQFDPHSIISDYNEYASVLDIPFRATKGDEYGDNTVNTKHKLKQGELMKFTMHPEFTNGVQRVLELRLCADAATTNAAAIADLKFKLVNMKKGVTNEYENVTLLLKAFSEFIDDDKDPFITIDFNRSLPLVACNQLAVLLDSIDSEGGIRIEPPVNGDLHYRAFMPDEKMRDRTKRYIQPLELHLKLLDGEIDGTLIKVNEIWGVGNTPELDPQLFPVSLYANLVDAVTEAKDKHPVLLIFPEEKITLGQLLDYIAPVRESHKYINIYLPQKAGE